MSVAETFGGADVAAAGEKVHPNSFRVESEKIGRQVRLLADFRSYGQISSASCMTCRISSVVEMSLVCVAT